jgi:DNA replication protein DnaC
LPLEKSWQTLDLKRLPTKVVQQARSLLEGSFVDRHENVLVFGQPGSGKTHLLCALGQELVRTGRRVQFAKSGLLVQELLAAKRDLKLSRVLKRLAGYEVLILDDLLAGQQTPGHRGLVPGCPPLRNCHGQGSPPVPGPPLRHLRSEVHPRW